ncbi:proteasome 26S subunit [Mycena capillaripes]|nr:proteasome 26S subunit [Mycena capillaripes]
MASPADTARALMLQKENIEAQLQLQGSILASNAGATMDSPLVDADGFPRADIDIYAVRNARIRIIELRNDLAALMNDLALALQSVYDPALAPPDSPQSTPNGKPFAKVEGVSPGSPAAEAGLQRNDLVVKFGSLTQHSFSSSSLAPLVAEVRENRSIPLKVLRSDQIVFLSLTPKTWGGRGLLGCHIVPYSPP